MQKLYISKYNLSKSDVTFPYKSNTANINNTQFSGFISIINREWAKENNQLVIRDQFRYVQTRLTVSDVEPINRNKVCSACKINLDFSDNILKFINNVNSNSFSQKEWHISDSISENSVNYVMQIECSNVICLPFMYVYKYTHKLQGQPLWLCAVCCSFKENNCQKQSAQSETKEIENYFNYISPTIK